MAEPVSLDSLPPPMYKGGFSNSCQATELILQHFGIKRPATLYYPGSSNDVSLAFIDDVHTIHADKGLTDAGLQGFYELGLEAHRTDAHVWCPPDQIDAVAFINPSGIRERQVLETINLRLGGVVLWASWSGLPSGLEDSPIVDRVAVIDNDEVGDLAIQTTNLDDYFAFKDFGDLTDDELERFNTKLARYLSERKIEPTIPVDQLYQQLQQPNGRRVIADVGYRFPYQRDASYFIYQRPA